MNSNEIVHLTHNDLDALGCMLHLEIATPNIRKVNIHTNYQNLVEKVSDTYDYCIDNSPKLLLITDISFADKKEQLLKLQSLKEHIDTTIVFLDHHEYVDGYFDDITITYRHNTNKSATQITQEFFKTKGTNSNLDVLSDTINAYDIWLDSTNFFKHGITINTYFWDCIVVRKNKITIEDLCYKIVNNNYKLPKDFKDFYYNYTIDTKAKIEKYRQNNLIMTDNFFAVAFVDDCFSEIILEETTKGAQFVLIANSYGIVRYRFNTKAYITREQKEEIKMKLLGTLNIGHLNAFSDKIPNSTFDKIIQKVTDVKSILEGYRK